MAYRVEVRKPGEPIEVADEDLSRQAACAFAVEVAALEPGTPIMVVDEAHGEVVWDTLCSAGGVSSNPRVFVLEETEGDAAGTDEGAPP